MRWRTYDVIVLWQPGRVTTMAGISNQVHKAIVDSHVTHFLNIITIICSVYFYGGAIDWYQYQQKAIVFYTQHLVAKATLLRHRA